MSAANRLIVFDVDGTLIDSFRMIAAAMARAAQICDQATPPAATLRRAIGLPLADAIRQAFPAVPAELVPRMATAYKESFWALARDGEHDEHLFPGARDALDRLDRAGFILGIATSKGRNGLDAALGRHGILGLFATLQTADVGLGKPHPDMLHRAMAEAGVEPARTVMIGDTTYDIEMARAARAVAIGVDWGYHASDELLAAGAHHIVDDFAALHDAIAAWSDPGNDTA